MKKEWKTPLLVIGVILAYFFFKVLFLGFGIAYQISNMFEAAKEGEKEEVRVQNLLEIKAVIVTNSNVVNPVSQNSSSLYAMKIGTKQKTSGGNIRGSSGYFEYQFPDYVINYPNDTKLLIGDKFYSIDFKRAVLTKLGNFEEEKRGVFIKKFEVANTNHYYFKGNKHFNPKTYDSLRKMMKLRIGELKGMHKIIDSYLGDDKNYEVDVLLLEEYKFNSGDTLIFKGKIVEDKIEPLF